MRRLAKLRDVGDASNDKLLARVKRRHAIDKIADHRRKVLATSQAPRRKEVGNVRGRGRRRHPQCHAAAMASIAIDQRVDSACRRRAREPDHDAGISPGLTRVHDPGDIAIVVNLDARHHALGEKPLGVYLLDEQRLLQIDLPGLAAPARANDGHSGDNLTISAHLPSVGV